MFTWERNEKDSDQFDVIPPAKPIIFDWIQTGMSLDRHECKHFRPVWNANVPYPFYYTQHFTHRSIFHDFVPVSCKHVENLNFHPGLTSFRSHFQLSQSPYQFRASRERQAFFRHATRQIYRPRRDEYRRRRVTIKLPVSQILAVRPAPVE